MHNLNGKKILIGITGSIAAYKTLFLIRELKKLGAITKVVLTQSAKQVVSTLTIQALSGEAIREEIFDHNAENAMSHIELAKWPEYLLITPASANFIAKMANGIADDLLSTLYLALNDIPIIVCPAMNKNMWQHPATKHNCDILQKRNIMILGPDLGEQACGDFGLGRLVEYQTIIHALAIFDIKDILSGHNLVITAGPTIEHIDPVRYITNHSSGKMGYALASAATIAGAKVTLISGPTNLSAPIGVNLIKIETAKEMLNSTLKNIEKNDIFIGTAAVADYYIQNPAMQKIKKSGEEHISLHLSKNPDIIHEVVKNKMAKYIVGFAAETNNVLENAKNKLLSKKLDMIVANKVGDNQGFNNDENSVIVLTKNDSTILGQEHKLILAGKIIKII